MIRKLLAGVFVLGVLGSTLVSRAVAEPYLAVQTGYQCNICHVNPTGGGLRNNFGVIFAKTLLPAETLDDKLDAWTGKVLDDLRVGGDLRADWSTASAPNTPAQTQFAVEQFRVYGDLSIIPDRLGLYVDELVAPGGSQIEEAYVRYGSATQGFYFKGGQFYLPYGWRLQDQTALVREATGISMAIPDQGVEFGYDHASWSAQLDFSNGAANADAGSGHQVTTNIVYVRPGWRLGVSGAVTQSELGNRQEGGLYGGLRTGPVAWLAEADLVHDESFPGGRRTAAGLLEADWRVLKGHNLKLTAEYFDPDRSIRDNQQTRYSFVYEFTPIPFLQLRAGFRRSFGIPQSNSENQRLSFLELHGYF